MHRKNKKHHSNRINPDYIKAKTESIHRNDIVLVSKSTPKTRKNKKIIAKQLPQKKRNNMSSQILSPIRNLTIPNPFRNAHMLVNF